MKQKAFTLLELLMGVLLMSMMVLGGLLLFSTALKSYHRTDTRLDLSQANALAMRRVTEEIRSAIGVVISGDGTSLQYSLPKLSASVDPATGEHEYITPLEPDGVVRSFFVQDGKLYRKVGTAAAEPLAEEISPTDPQEGSAYYNEPYPVFSLTNVGSGNGVKVMLISRRYMPGSTQFSRMSTTVQLRNF